MTTQPETEVAGLRGWRVPLIVGGAVAIILFASSIVINAVQASTYLPALVSTDVATYLAGQITQLGSGLVRDALFGFGVALALRFVVAKRVRLDWRHQVAAIAIAAALGAAVILIVFVLGNLVITFSLGPHPFGYSAQPTVDQYSLGSGIANAFVSAVVAFVSGVPVVGVVVLWLRQFGRNAT
jgi:hypothetical protein